MSKSHSKEFFKKNQRGRAKRNSLTNDSAASTSGQTASIAPIAKLLPIQTSQGSATGLLGNGEDPALVVINPLPPNSNHKEKRTKICCLL